MKEHAKKALKHDISIAGKTVPTMLIAAIFLVGGGSAAILNTFGTVSGTADASQAIKVNNQAFSSDGDAFSYSRTLVGGDLIESDTTISNSADEAVPVSVSTTSSEAGLDTYYLLTSNADVDGNGYDLSVNVSESHVQDGEYSVRFHSDSATRDYAKLFYPASLTETSKVTYQAYKGSNSENPVDDELWLLQEDGSLHMVRNGGAQVSGDSVKTVTYDFSSSSISYIYNATNQNPISVSNFDFSSVVAIGIGQGWPSSSGKIVNNYVDDVKVDGSSVDELSNPTFHLAPTSAQNFDHRLHVVTDAQINLEGGSYSIDTAVNPVTE